MTRNLLQVALMSALICSATGCDKLAALNPNRVPTDDEIFAVYLGYWNQNEDGASRWSRIPFRDYVQPYAAHKADDGITRDDAFGKEYSVTIKFTYRALRDVFYRCGTGLIFHFEIYPIGTDMSQVPGAFTAPAGQLFTCNEAHSFSKIEEGWIFHMTSTLSYTIRR